jgi:uncharacterized protein
VPDVHLTLCLTHDCNLRCRYCYGGEKAARHMELATGRRAIELALGRAAERLHLIFFGGEPLLRWATLVALTAAARDLAAAAGVELRLSVTTNGTLLTAARVRWLRAEDALVVVSCDGTPAAHDLNRVDRRGRRSHGRVLAGLRRALTAGLRVRTVVVLDPSTIDDLPDSVEHLAAAGARDVVVNVNWSADWADGEVARRREAAYVELARRYVEAFRRGRPFWVSLLDDKIATHVRGGYRPWERCDFGRRDLVVAPSGNLYPCDRLVGEDRAGGGHVVGTVETGVDARRLAELVSAACRAPAACRECAVGDRCRNRCGCANLAMTGDLGRPSPALCTHEQLAIRCADDAAETLVAERNEAFLRRHYGEIGV